jgi:exodeoxyribonuclease V gamma subunit
MSIDIYFGNCLERLTAQLASCIAAQQNSNDPLRPITVILPNRNIRKWLQLDLARRQGISVNLEFGYLEQGLWKILDSLYDGPPVTLLDEPTLQRLVLAVLLNIPELPAASREPLRLLADYLPDQAHSQDYARRLWQLSGRLARLLREYEYNRADIIRNWDGNRPAPLGPRADPEVQRAQQALYRLLFGPDGLRNRLGKRALSLYQFAQLVFSRLDLESPPPAPTFHVFGLSQTSSFHSDLLLRLGQFARIHIYQLSMCSEFWEDMSTAQEARWRRIVQAKVVETDGDQELASPAEENELLMHFGKVGRETARLLSDLEDRSLGHLDYTPHLLYEDPCRERRSLLAHVQTQVLRRSALALPKDICRDLSVQIAGCPGIHREVECVYQTILHNMHQDPNLQLTDIAVLVPDMGRYKSAIEAVFLRGPHRVPFNLSDSRAREDSAYGQALLAMLQLAGGRFTRRDVFALLYNPCFLAAHDLERRGVHAWVGWADALNIFHSFDAQHREDQGFAPNANFTWQQAMQRIRLGRLMTTDGDHHFHERVPFADMASQDPRAAGAFCHILETLHHELSGLHAAAKTASQWQNSLLGLMDRFLAIPGDRQEEEHVRSDLTRGLRGFAELDPITRDTRLPLAIVVQQVTAVLDRMSSQHGSYLTGGVTIAAMHPMRPIPFRNVYIMGLEEGRFPGTSDPTALDLRTSQRRIGDISRPDANRYLFLEILMSARDKLYLSYVNRDLQKDQTLHPCSALVQVRQYLERISGSDFSPVDMPLRGSSEKYLQEYPDELSHDWRVNYDNSDRLVALLERGANSPAVEQQLAAVSPDFRLPELQPPETGIIAIELHHMERFLLNPVDATLKRHLRVFDYADDERDLTQEEDEPFESDNFLRRRLIDQVIDELIEQRLSVSEIADFASKRLATAYQIAQRRGDVPEGDYGSLDLDHLQDELHTRITGGGKHPGVGGFLAAERHSHYFRAVRFGSPFASSAPIGIRELPALRLSLPSGDEVELHGMLPHVWRNNSGACETVISNYSYIKRDADLPPCDALTPFLFMLMLKAADVGLPPEEQWIGRNPFDLHIVHRFGTDTWRWNPDPDFAQRYLMGLAVASRRPNYDLLPFGVIAGELEITRPWATMATQDIQNSYSRDLEDAILEDRESMFPRYRRSNLLRLAAAAVPPDAYLKVRSRFRAFLKDAQKLTRP